MADLLHIVPSTTVEAVRINGNRDRIIVRGLHSNAIASIAVRFPQLKLLLSGGGDIAIRIIEQGDALGPIIAAGCGHLGDEKQEAAASQLLLEDQFKLLTAILGLTFPNGFGSFLAELTNLMNRVASLMGGESEGAKIHKVRLKRSPSPSQPLSNADSRPTIQ